MYGDMSLTAGQRPANEATVMGTAAAHGTAGRAAGGPVTVVVTVTVLAIMPAIT